MARVGAVACVLALTLVALTLAACGRGSSEVAVPSDGGGVGEPSADGSADTSRRGGPRDLDSLFAGWHQLDQVPAFGSLEPLLPNRHYRFADGSHAATHAVILGRVRAVEPDRGFRNGSEEDGGDRVPLEERSVEYGSAKVDWSTVRLTVEVLDRFGSENPVADTIAVGVSNYGPDELPALRAALLAQSQLVMFLDDDSAVFAYDDDLYAIQVNNTMLATVDPTGRLHLAGLDSAGDEQQLTGIETHEKLRAAGAEPVEVRAWPKNHPCSIPSKQRPRLCGQRALRRLIARTSTRRCRPDRLACLSQDCHPPAAKSIRRT